MKTIKVKLTFTEPLLGTWPADQNVAREYIASKGPDSRRKARALHRSDGRGEAGRGGARQRHSIVR